jgi:hypothetical protein
MRGRRIHRAGIFLSDQARRRAVHGLKNPVCTIPDTRVGWLDRFPAGVGVQLVGEWSKRALYAIYGGCFPLSGASAGSIGATGSKWTVLDSYAGVVIRSGETGRGGLVWPIVAFRGSGAIDRAGRAAGAGELVQVWESALQKAQANIC